MHPQLDPSRFLFAFLFLVASSPARSLLETLSRCGDLSALTPVNTYGWTPSPAPAATRGLPLIAACWVAGACGAGRLGADIRSPGEDSGK